MSLMTFTAIQPTCDAMGCMFTMNGDYEQWYKENDVQRAAEDWAEYEGYVSADRTVWLCETHRVLGPHNHVPEEGDPLSDCVQCGVDYDEHEEVSDATP